MENSHQLMVHGLGSSLVQSPRLRSPTSEVEAQLLTVVLDSTRHIMQKRREKKASRTNVQTKNGWTYKILRQMVIAILRRQEHPKKLTCSQEEEIKKENKKKRKIRTKREESSEAN